MLHAQNLSYIHILYTQKGVYIIFEYKKNFEREVFRFSMIFINGHQILNNKYQVFDMYILGINNGTCYLIKINQA